MNRIIAFTFYVLIIWFTTQLVVLVICNLPNFINNINSDVQGGPDVTYVK